VKLGVVYPQIELGGDPEAVAAIGRAVELIGYDQLVVYDHVVGAEHADREPPLWGPYTDADPFHDPFVMLGYLAGLTSRIQLATGVLILPQRQTVLVAQQAADVDLFSGGRLRLGVGTGWNHVEYHALGEDFGTRGARLDEQIVFLRRLWSESLVSFAGRFDRIERGNINPRPRHPIPIWVGGFSEPAFRRGGRFGDGYSFAGDVGTCIEAIGRVRHHLAEAGRSADGFGLELIPTRADDLAKVVEAAERWQDAGGTHCSLVTMRRGMTSAQAHIDYIGECYEAVRSVSDTT
jgi:probable F420-dependent oxidoreductase